MNYKHLAAADRGAIEALLKLEYTLTDIARVLGVSGSTVCREVNKHSTSNGYMVWVAQLEYEKARKKSRKKRSLDNTATCNYIIKRLKKGWSPEQVSGRMRLKGRTDYVCPETIYQWLYTNGYCLQEKLHQYLRLGRKKRKKCQRGAGRKRQRCKIPNRVSIHKRPKKVDKRLEFGHWEGDSVICVNRRAINTLNELKSGVVIFTALEERRPRGRLWPCLMLWDRGTTLSTV